jgi:hypothetical protein
MKLHRNKPRSVKQLLNADIRYRMRGSTTQHDEFHTADGSERSSSSKLQSDVPYEMSNFGYLHAKLQMIKND